MTQLSVACLQLTSTDDMAENIRTIAPMVARAAGEGAAFVLLPENAFCMEAPGAPGARLSEAEHPGIAAARDWAAVQGCWLLVGSVAVTVPGESRRANRSLLIDAAGNIAARYDKIHLFDVDLGGGERYAESAKMLPGNQAVVAETPWGLLGMSVCYDVRFPHLYRALAKQGADLLTVPAAFTRKTGEAHWHVLLRARAIENGCFVLAPAQCGTHPGKRETYGHALVVDPWGAVLADGGEQSGIVHATLDLSKVAQVRAALPSLQHDRDYR